MCVCVGVSVCECGRSMLTLAGGGGSIPTFVLCVAVSTSMTLMSFTQSRAAFHTRTVPSLPPVTRKVPCGDSEIRLFKINLR